MVGDGLVVIALHSVYGTKSVVCRKVGAVEADDGLVALNRLFVVAALGVGYAEIIVEFYRLVVALQAFAQVRDGSFVIVALGIHHTEVVVGIDVVGVVGQCFAELGKGVVVVAAVIVNHTKSVCCSRQLGIDFQCFLGPVDGVGIILFEVVNQRHIAICGGAVRIKFDGSFGQLQQLVHTVEVTASCTVEVTILDVASHQILKSFGHRIVHRNSLLQCNGCFVIVVALHLQFADQQ